MVRALYVFLSQTLWYNYAVKPRDRPANMVDMYDLSRMCAGGVGVWGCWLAGWARMPLVGTSWWSVIL